MTALRWSRVLRDLGQRVEIAQRYTDQPCDLLVALHARKSGRSVIRFRDRNANQPIILALTGTDLYRDIRTSDLARRSLQLADRLVVLQPCGLSALPAALRGKTHVIYQSAEPVANRLPPLKRAFEICVAAHLRAVKDPFRAAQAARLLPTSSRILITHLGGALSAAVERRARSEARRNPRYRWWEEVPHWKARRLIARSRLLVLSSKSEGGANVISEALVDGVPILASRIDGSIGLLGERYPGYFAVGDTRQLAALMQRSESQPDFYKRLKTHCVRQGRLFHPRCERAAWQDLIRRVAN